MNIQEEAKKYAKNRIVSVIEQAVAEAYVKGYNAACEELNKEEKRLVEVDGVKFIDFGLPSGTLWSSRLFKDGNEKFTYNEAIKYSIPTYDQWQELLNKAIFQVTYFGVKIISVDGLEVEITPTEYDSSGNDAIEFWLKDERGDKQSNHSYVIYRSITETKPIYISSLLPVCSFKGKKLPILLVKSK